tara:strand:+ start:519 stop:1268 length:750 start_codon:yes stop_codon:yes gene_type:complete
MIRRDCSLSKCVFSTKYPGVKNCILVYMAKQGIDSLKPLDISLLKGIPSNQVSRSLSKATVLMRNNTLKVSNQVDIEPKFKVLMGMNTCYHCETPITSKNQRHSVESKIPRTGEKVVYCSSKCAEARPAQYVAAEAACGTDIKNIVSWAVKKYSTLGGLEQALGMNRTLLGKTLKDLLGLEADTLYSTTERVKTRSKSLVRRTGSRPEWLTSFHEILQPLIDDMSDEHGPPTVDHSSLIENVNNVIESI